MMRKLLADIPYFLEAANCSSFTQAADNLGIPLATMSRRIAALEKNMGVRLFYRNTRNIGLTEEGQELLESSRLIVAEASGVRDRLQQKQTDPSGPIRVSIEAFVYHCFMHDALSSFANKYPKICLHTVFPGEWKDLHTEPFDLDIRSGPVPYTELKVRKVLSIYPRLYASPNLLERCPNPKYPKDLGNLPFISQLPESRCTFSCFKGDQIEQVTLHPRHNAQSIRLALELVRSGQGFSTFLPLIADRFEADGDLIRLLPDWSLNEVEVHLLLPDRQQPQRIRLFVDHLVEHFRQLQSENSSVTYK
jgi:DNA-binding transcriptional LysR family regulator